MANGELWRELNNYTKCSPSSGCSYSDYWVLYKYIKEAKPKEVLECGTGVSTIVMAHAMSENEKENNIKGRITSMEDKEEYYHHVSNCLPDRLKKYVEIVCSPRVEHFYCLFRGVGYKNIPDRPYDFVFIDGPGTSATSDGAKTFDFDFINVVLRSEKPVYAMVDTRMSTCWAFKNIFKEGKVLYDYRYDLGFIGPCAKDDLRSTNEIIRSLGPYPLKRGCVWRRIKN